MKKHVLEAFLHHHAFSEMGNFRIVIKKSLMEKRTLGFCKEYLN